MNEECVFVYVGEMFVLNLNGDCTYFGFPESSHNIHLNAQKSGQPKRTKFKQSLFLEVFDHYF